MIPFNKPFDEIKFEDIQKLIDDKYVENKYIDYKSEFDITTQVSKKDKKEDFLIDIASFANSQGGFLVFGIKDKQGAPEHVSGIENINIDEIKLQIQDIINRWIVPKIIGVNVGKLTFPDDETKSIIIVYIPKSLNSPHQILYNDNYRFYYRVEGKNERLDVYQLRDAFITSATRIDRMKQFLMERVSKILNDDAPVKLLPDPKTILHIVPVNAFSDLAEIDISMLKNKLALLQPLFTSGCDHRYNYDGFLTYSLVQGTSNCRSYLQVFRNGTFEAVETSMLNYKTNTILIKAFECEIIKAIRQYLSVIKSMEINPPLLVSLFLHGISGYKLGVDPMKFTGSSNINENTLKLPLVSISDYDEINIESKLKPIFDVLWQSAGFERCYDYDNSGNWIRNS